MKQYFMIAALAAFSISCEKNCEEEKVSFCEEEKESFKLELQPNSEEGKDAFIEDYQYDGYRDRNWGDSKELSAISWTAGGANFVVRSFFEFNLDEIPVGAVIDSAKLSLYVLNENSHYTAIGHSVLGGTNLGFIHRVTESWEEQTVTWNNQPDISDVNRVVLNESENSLQDYENIDVTSIVEDMYFDKENSFGFMIRLVVEDSYRQLLFASSDYEDELKHPKLEVYYSK